MAITARRDAARYLFQRALLRQPPSFLAAFTSFSSAFRVPSRPAENSHAMVDFLPEDYRLSRREFIFCAK